MKNIGIEVRSFWKPLHLFKTFSKFSTTSDLSISKDFYERCICLPSSTSLKEEEINIVANEINNYFERN